MRHILRTTFTAMRRGDN